MGVTGKSLLVDLVYDLQEQPTFYTAESVQALIKFFSINFYFLYSM